VNAVFQSIVASGISRNGRPLEVACAPAPSTRRTAANDNANRARWATSWNPCVTVDALRHASAPQRCESVRGDLVPRICGCKTGTMILYRFDTEGALADLSYPGVSRRCTDACPHSRLQNPWRPSERCMGRFHCWVFARPKLTVAHASTQKCVSRESGPGQARPAALRRRGLCVSFCRMSRIAPVDYKSMEQCQAGDKRRIGVPAWGCTSWIG